MTAGYQYGYDLEAPAIVSTGNSFIFAPFGAGYELGLRLATMLDHYYDPWTGIMFVSCEEKTWYDDVKMYLDGYEFEIKVDDYFLNMNDLMGLMDVEDEFEEELGEMCFLAFIDTWEQEYWTLGTAFTKGYYSVFDNDDHANAKMGFIPTATSEKKVPT